MTGDQITIFMLLGALVVLLIWGRWRYDVFAFAALIVAVLSGLVPASEAFAAFLSRRHEVVLYANAQSVLNTLGRRFQLGALTNGNADVRKTEIGT